MWFSVLGVAKRYSDERIATPSSAALVGAGATGMLWKTDAGIIPEKSQKKIYQC